MTKQEMLASVEAQIRKDIPRLMELREGCLVRYNNDLFKIAKTSDEFYLLVYQGDSDIFQPFTKRIYEYNIPYDSIIGHDIMLNDVLEWLFNLKIEGHKYLRYDKNKHGKPLLDISYTALAKRTNGEYSDIFISSFWNLSSPYLKDQSEELIKFLYELIKE